MSSSTSRDPRLPESILIAEDDSSIRLLLQKGLGGTKIFTAENGLEALELLHAERPHFVITDISMPRLGGLEFIERARRTSHGASVPILVLTSLDGEDVLLKCFEAGADDFVHKPFSIREIKMRVWSIHLRQALARDINPLTQLPGNLILKREIEARMGDPACCAAYIDLDHFKEFNDSHGFERGDHLIRLVGDLLRDFVARHSPDEVFIGHVGGDDFIAILPEAHIDALARDLFDGFDSASHGFYSEEEVARGSFTAKSRAGKVRETPLVTISIGVVRGSREGMNDLRKVAQVAAEVKCVAKSKPGNTVFVDRRTE